MSTVKPWGCHSKPRATTYWASNGTIVVDNNTRRVQVPIEITDTGSLDCKYRQHTPNDPRCEGCTSP